MFNSREIAGLIWLSLFLIYILINNNTRKNVVDIIKAFSKLICTPLGLFIIIYIGIFIYIFCHFNIFGLLFVKNYIMWIILGLFPLINRMVTEVNTNIKEIIINVVKFSIIPMFIINEYTFSLPIEIILFPAIIFIILLSVIADMDKKYSQIKKIFDVLLSIIGVFIAFYAFRSFIINFKDIQKVSFWESMFSQVYFVFLHLPLLIIISLFVIYEGIIIRVNFDSKRTKVKAIIYLIIHCNFNKSKLLSIRKENRYGVKFTYKEFKNEIRVIEQRHK